MITYINNIIGFEYSAHPIPWVLCFLLCVWLMYQFIQLIYVILGRDKL